MEPVLVEARRPRIRGHERAGVVRWSLLALVATLVAAGCGGEGRLDREELVAKANEICAAYDSKQNDVLVPSADPTNPATPFRQRAMWGAAINQIAQIGRQEVKALRKLRPPEELEGRFGKFLAAKDAGFDALGETADAAKRNNPERVKTAGRTARAKLATVTKLADELGLSKCA